MANLCRASGHGFWYCLDVEIQSMSGINKLIIGVLLLAITFIVIQITRKWLQAYMATAIIGGFMSVLLCISILTYFVSVTGMSGVVHYQDDVYEEEDFIKGKRIVDNQTKINVMHDYVESHEDAEEYIEKESYTLHYDDFKRDVKDETLRLHVDKEKYGLIPVDLRANDGDALERTIYPEVTCSDRKDVELTGYHAKEDIAVDFPTGFYNATLDIPEDTGVCEAIHQEKNIFEPN